MTDHDHDLASATGTYVLHSGDEEEMARFDELLARSEHLRAEVVELSDTVVELGLAVPPEAPRPGLRDELLARIAELPQSGPAMAEPPRAAVTPITAAAATRRRRPTPGRRVPRSVAVLAPLAAAAAVVAAVGAGLAVTNAPGARVAAVHSAGDTRSAHVAVRGGGTLRVSWSDRLGAAAVTADGLPRLRGGRVYELWYLDGGSARPAGTFDGRDALPLSGRFPAGARIAMTVEPAGGSAAPSSAPIAVAAT